MSISEVLLCEYQIFFPRFNHVCKSMLLDIIDGTIFFFLGKSERKVNEI